MFKRFWWVFLVSLILGPLAGVFVGGVIAYVSPKQYEAAAVLQVRPVVPPVNVASSDTAPCIPTELEMIRSESTLDSVDDNRLDLVDRWAMPKNQVLLQLRQSIETSQIKSTDLFEIRVRTSNPHDSKIIAEAVADTYRSRRKEVEWKRADHALKELREAVRAQEEEVEEGHKVLAQMIRDGNYPGSDPITSAQKFAQLETEKIKLESQIDTLLRYEGEQLLTYAAGLNLPENIVKLLYPRLLEARRRLASAEKSGLGQTHPTVIQQQKLIEGLGNDLEEGVVALRETLRAQLALVTEQTERLRIKKDQEEASITRATPRRSFNDLKSAFETAQTLLEQLKVKLISEEMQHRISEDPVVVHSDPVEAITPASPNIALHLLFGVGGGLLLGLLAPFGLIPLFHRLAKPAS